MLVGRRALVGGFLAGVAAPLWSAPLSERTQLDILTAAARAMFPHHAVPDATYRRVVASALSQATPAARIAFADAAAKLSGPPADLERRIASTLETPGTRALRITALLGLYNDATVTRSFGYPGPSLEFGGYLEHGFAELPWLPPAPPAWLP